jgi:diaminopimelate epimerase
VTAELFKVEGAGNDFILGVGPWSRRLDNEPDLVRRLCDRRRGIGADGSLAVEPVGHDRVWLGYRNADGGRAAFCANGSRCAARAAVELLGCGAELVIETGWDEIPAMVGGSRVSLDLPPPGSTPLVPGISAPDDLHHIRLIEVGVPHLAAAVDGLAGIDLEMVAPPLRHHPELGPDGANVNLYEVGTGSIVRVRSFERGIEGETLSCGSGLVAVALIVMAEANTKEVTVVPRSGDQLLVEALGAPPVCSTRFTGPARFVAEIEPLEELLSAV